VTVCGVGAVSGESGAAGTSGGADEAIDGAVPVVDCCWAEAGPRISTEADNINANAIAPRVITPPRMDRIKSISK
jgi:hypothetical protein